MRSTTSHDGGPSTHQRPARREAFAVAAFERGHEPITFTHGAQPHPAHVDVEGVQFDRVAVGARVVVEARARMAREPEERARQAPVGETREPNASCTASSRMSSRSALSQSSGGVDSIIARIDSASRMTPRRRGVSRYSAPVDALAVGAPRSPARRCARAAAAIRLGGRAARNRRSLSAMPPDRPAPAPHLARAHRFERRDDVFAHARRRRTCTRCAAPADRCRWPTRRVTSRRRLSSTAASILASSTARSMTRPASTSASAARVRSRANQFPIAPEARPPQGKRSQP